MSKTRYALTLTCEADSPEDLIRLLDFKKKDLHPLEVSLTQIKDTLEHAASLPGVTLAGKSGVVKYVVEASRVSEGPRVTFPPPCTTTFPPPCTTTLSIAPAVLLNADRPEGCQAEGQGGNCGGLDRCDQSGVCAGPQKESTDG